MRAIGLAAMFVMGMGCAKDVLDETTYRRLVNEFDTYDQCLADGEFAPCYQTLTFCPDGQVNANLEYRQEGSYELEPGGIAIAKLPSVTVVFDLERHQSKQLPGRHPWELVAPLQADCEAL